MEDGDDCGHDDEYEGEQGEICDHDDGDVEIGRKRQVVGILVRSSIRLYNFSVKDAMIDRP